MEKRLLELLRDLVASQKSIKFGLCYEITQLSYSGDITLREKESLRNFILDNRPREGEHRDSKYAVSDFFWEPELVEPRLKWLKWLIENYKEETT